MIRRLSIFLLFILITGCLSKENVLIDDYQAWSFHHIDKKCQTWIERPESSKFGEALTQLLAKRGWRYQVLNEDKRLFENDLYFMISKEKMSERPVYESVFNRKLGTTEKVSKGSTKLFYNDCKVVVQIKQAEGNVARKTDKVLYEGIKIRNHPRITKEGEERCTRALKEVFLNIPYCLTQDRYEFLKKKFSK